MDELAGGSAITPPTINSLSTESPKLKSIILPTTSLLLNILDANVSVMNMTFVESEYGSYDPAMKGKSNASKNDRVTPMPLAAKDRSPLEIAALSNGTTPTVALTSGYLAKRSGRGRTKGEYSRNAASLSCLDTSR